MKALYMNIKLEIDDTASAQATAEDIVTRLKAILPNINIRANVTESLNLDSGVV